MSILNNYPKTDKCVLISITGREYKKISDIPENEYLNIHTIKDMPVELLKIDDFFFKIEKFCNLRFISCDFDDWCKLLINPIINNLAHFQKLSILAIIDYNQMSFIPYNIGYFISGNKMTIFNPKIRDLEIVPSTIEYLNIINTEEHNYINIPDTIEHLHLSIQKLSNYKQTNLPFGLKTITITIPEKYKMVSKYEIDCTIISNTKLPFNCELIIDYIYSSVSASASL